MDKDRTRWSRIVGMTAAGALGGVLTLPGRAGGELPGAEITERYNRAAPPRVQQATPGRRDIRPGPETRNWGRDRDDRHDRFGHDRDRDDRFARGYWAVP